MISYLDKLNLTQQERRLVIGVVIVVFIALNAVFVFPYFGELARIEKRMSDKHGELQKYRSEIVKRPVYEKQRIELEKAGQPIPAEEQDMKLTREVNDMAQVVGLYSAGSTLVSSGGGGKTNIFFQEKAIQLNFQNSGEKELVDFLNNLGAANTLIRVKNMNIRPEQGRMKLGGQLTLVKSFQRKQVGKTSATPAATSASTTPKPVALVAKPSTPAAPTNARPTLPKPNPGLPAPMGSRRAETNAAAHRPGLPMPGRPIPTPIRPNAGTNNAAKVGSVKKI